METDLTKRIKCLTHSYRPKLNTSMRTIRWADEVWTPTGIVDSIRFEDYYANEEYLCRMIDANLYSEMQQQTSAYVHKPGECFRDGSTMKNDKKCHGCVHRRHLWEVGMMVTCFEVKITLSDFRSRNGHNFQGNENYYCVPKELAPKIMKEVPDDIGILAYFEGERQFGLREYKQSSWHELDDSTKVILLYNAMKKWCDKAVFV
ncbi:hypothetical protein [Lacrimispora indolis]|uniref:hypothetical protein n=1 Tax=Lacrimispora indolis TaxID=69825 RepID=UPI00046270C9|nr:hypothetical protein [[Clostridium] methoxybenzovorans]